MKGKISCINQNHFLHESRM